MLSSYAETLTDSFEKNGVKVNTKKGPLRFTRITVLQKTNGELHFPRLGLAINPTGFPIELEKFSSDLMDKIENHPTKVKSDFLQPNLNKKSDSKKSTTFEDDDDIMEESEPTTHVKPKTSSNSSTSTSSAPRKRKASAPAAKVTKPADDEEEEEPEASPPKKNQGKKTNPKRTTSAPANPTAISAVVFNDEEQKKLFVAADELEEKLQSKITEEMSKQLFDSFLDSDYRIKIYYNKKDYFDSKGDSISQEAVLVYHPGKPVLNVNFCIDGENFTNGSHAVDKLLSLAGETERKPAKSNAWCKFNVFVVDEKGEKKWHQLKSIIPFAFRKTMVFNIQQKGKKKKVVANPDDEKTTTVSKTTSSSSDDGFDSSAEIDPQLDIED